MNEDGINKANYELLKKLIELAKKHKIQARITCGAVSVELGESVDFKPLSE